MFQSVSYCEVCLLLESSLFSLGLARPGLSEGASTFWHHPAPSFVLKRNNI